MPFVKPSCVEIIRSPQSSTLLRRQIILLLANVSRTASQDLRDLGAAEVLLDLKLQNNAKRNDRNNTLGIAKSVIIYLHGDRTCRIVDKLMQLDVVNH